MATTEFTHSEPTTLAHGFQHFVQASAARVAAAWRSAKNRRSVNQLLGWDDRMLSDIGLTQGDVRSALASRFAEDPSYRLRSFCGERKAAERAQRSQRPSEWRVDI